MEAIITEINAWAWGVPMQVLLLGTGIFLTIGLGFLTWKRLGLLSVSCSVDSKGRERAIFPFPRLDDLAQRNHRHGQYRRRCNGHDAGWPRALFWMWLTALFGMAMNMQRPY